MDFIITSLVTIKKTIIIIVIKRIEIDKGNELCPNELGHPVCSHRTTDIYTIYNTLYRVSRDLHTAISSVIIEIIKFCLFLIRFRELTHLLYLGLV